MINTTTDHSCDSCGYTPKSDNCFCSECVEDMKDEAYEEGKKEGIKEGRLNP